MTVRELIKELLSVPLDDEAYVGKGMGPVREAVQVRSALGSGTVVVIKP